MEGTLWKWTNYLSGWQLRYFVLDGDELRYYDDEAHYRENEAKFRASIKMGPTASNIEVYDNSITIKGIKTGAIYHLQADTSESRQLWLSKIGTARACSLQVGYKPTVVPRRERLPSVDRVSITGSETSSVAGVSGRGRRRVNKRPGDTSKDIRVKNEEFQVARPAKLTLRENESGVTEETFHTGVETPMSHADMIEQQIQAMQRTIDQFTSCFREHTLAPNLDTLPDQSAILTTLQSQLARLQLLHAEYCTMLPPPSPISVTPTEHSIVEKTLSPYEISSRLTAATCQNPNTRQESPTPTPYRYLPPSTSPGGSSTSHHQPNPPNPSPNSKTTTPNANAPAARTATPTSAAITSSHPSQPPHTNATAFTHKAAAQTATTSSSLPEAKASVNVHTTGTSTTSTGLHNVSGSTNVQKGASAAARTDVGDTSVIAGRGEVSGSVLPTPPDSDLEEGCDASGASVRENLDRIGDELVRLSSQIETVPQSGNRGEDKMVSKSFFSERPVSFKHVPRDANSQIQTKEFLAACKEFSQLYDILGGKIFTPLKGDVTGNIVKVEKHAGEQNIATLEALVENELKNKTDGKSGSATDALLWLKRGLSLFCKFLRRMVNGEREPGTAFNAAYQETLAKVHGWIVRKTVSTMLYALPAQETLMDLLLEEHDPNDGGREEVVLNHVEEYISHMEPLLEQLDNFYTSKHLKNWN